MVASIKCWIFLLFAHFYYQPAHTLKITELDVPRDAFHRVIMNCRYDLEGAKLYDVKWYKDDQQFLQCKADESVQQFPLYGISFRHPDISPIGNCQVTLTWITGHTAGKYRCEVSVEGPPFFSVSETKFLREIRVSSQRTEELNEVESSFQNQTSIDNGGGRPRSFATLMIFVFILLNKYI